MRRGVKLRKIRWKVFQRIFAAVLFLMAVGLYFSDHIVAWGVQSARAHLFPDATLSFQKVRFRGGKVQFFEVRFSGERGDIEAPLLTIKGEYTLRPFVIFPHIEMKRPQITLREAVRGIETLFYTSKRIVPSFRITQGILYWKEHPFDFSLQSTQGKEGEIRSGAHNLFCGWKQTETGIDVELHLKETPLALLTPLIHGLGVEMRAGEATFSGSGALSHTFTPRTFQGEGSVHHVKGCAEEYGGAFEIEKATFQISLPRKVEEMTLTADLVEGNLALDAPFHHGRWDLIHLNGGIRREGGGPFHAQVNGAVLRAVGGFPFHMEAQGETLTRWSADVTFDDQEEATLSVASTPDGYTCTFSEWDPLLIDLGQEVLFSKNEELANWEVTEGILSGEVKLRPSGNLQIKRMVGRDLRMQNYVARTFCSLKKGKVQGELTSEGEVHSLRSIVDGFDADLIQEDGEIWNLSGLSGSVAMRRNEMAPSHVKGTFLGLVGEMHIEGPSLLSATHFRLQGGVDHIVSLFSQELSEAYHEHEELPVKIKGSVHGDPTMAHVDVDLFIGEKEGTPLHLDATCANRTIQRATFTSQRVPHTLYAPLITSLFPSLEIGGDWALSGAYQNGSLTCTMASTNALVGHSTYPLTIAVDKSGVQATLKGDVSVDRWHLSLPSFKGELKGAKPFPFAFETTLDILKEPGKSWTTQAQITAGSVRLAEQLNITDLAFSARFDEASQTLILQNLQGMHEGTSLTTDAISLSKHAEKWGRALFKITPAAAPSRDLKIEALSAGRNPNTFLLHIQHAHEAPRFYQGKRLDNVWTIEPLPEDPQSAH